MALTDGLVALYQFTGNTLDSSPNSNHATNNGITFVNDKNAVANQAGNYDGITNYIATPLTESAYPTDIMGISLFFNTSSLATIQWIMFSSGGGSNDSPFLRINTDGSIISGIRGASAQRNVASPAATISINTWYHIVMTGNSTGYFELWIEKVSQGTNTGSTGAWGTWPAVDVGRRTTTNVDNFVGIIDEVRFYNRLITTLEVTELFDLYDGAAPPISASKGLTMAGNGF